MSKRGRYRKIATNFVPEPWHTDNDSDFTESNDEDPGQAFQLGGDQAALGDGIPQAVEDQAALRNGIPETVEDQPALRDVIPQPVEDPPALHHGIPQADQPADDDDDEPVDEHNGDIEHNDVDVLTDNVLTNDEDMEDGDLEANGVGDDSDLESNEDMEFRNDVENAVVVGGAAGADGENFAADVGESDADWESSDEEEFQEIDTYQSILEHLSREWIQLEINHEVSKTASNAFWDLAKLWFHRLFRAKEIQKVKKKTPTFEHIRKTLHDKYVPPIKMEFSYKDRETGEVIITENLSKNPNSQFPVQQYKKLWETAHVEVTSVLFFQNFSSVVSFVFRLPSTDDLFTKILASKVRKYARTRLKSKQRCRGNAVGNAVGLFWSFF